MRTKGIVIATLFLLIIPIAQASDLTVVQFSDKYGYVTDRFLVYDTICIVGEGFEPNVAYSVSLVEGNSLVDGSAIPESAPDTTISVASGSEGDMALTVIWDQWNNTESHYLPVGDYCVVVDADNNGVYNEGVDVMDSMTIGYWAGITYRRGSDVPQFITPELPAGSVMALLGFLMAALLFRSRQKVA
jgi:hypothetical protein